MTTKDNLTLLWQPIPEISTATHTAPPYLFIKYSFDRENLTYDVLLTDLCHVWREKADIAYIARTHKHVDCILDVGEDPSQTRLLFGYLAEVLKSWIHRDPSPPGVVSVRYGPVHRDAEMVADIELAVRYFLSDGGSAGGSAGSTLHLDWRLKCTLVPAPEASLIVREVFFQLLGFTDYCAEVQTRRLLDTIAEKDLAIKALVLRISDLGVGNTMETLGSIKRQYNEKDARSRRILRGLERFSLTDFEQSSIGPLKSVGSTEEAAKLFARPLFRQAWEMYEKGVLAGGPVDPENAGDSAGLRESEDTEGIEELEQTGRNVKKDTEDGRKLRQEAIGETGGPVEPMRESQNVKDSNSTTMENSAVSRRGLGRIRRKLETPELLTETVGQNRTGKETGNTNENTNENTTGDSESSVTDKKPAKKFGVIKRRPRELQDTAEASEDKHESHRTSELTPPPSRQSSDKGVFSQKVKLENSEAGNTEEGPTDPTVPKPLPKRRKLGIIKRTREPTESQEMSSNSAPLLEDSKTSAEGNVESSESKEPAISPSNRSTSVDASESTQEDDNSNSLPTIDLEGRKHKILSRIRKSQPPAFKPRRF